jgi:tetratricopeptide (TPR) repeat protein
MAVKRKWLLAGLKAKVAVVMLVTVLSVPGCGQEVPVRSATEHPLAPVEALRWLERAESFVAKLEDSERFKVLSEAGETYVELGKIARAKALASEIQDQLNRCLVLFAIASYCVREEGTEAGIQYAQSLRRPEDRDFVLNSLATQFAQGHDFEAARNALQLSRLGRSPVVNRSIINDMANAGKYDLAEKLVGELVPITEADKKIVGDLKRSVAKARAENRCNPPNKPPCDTYSAQVRVGEYWLPLKDLEAAIAQARELPTGFKQAAAWRQIAWEYHRRGEVEQSQKAADEARAHLRISRNPLHQALDYIALADLYLELNMVAQARKVVDETLEPKKLTYVQQSLRYLLIGAFVVDVLVRSDRTQAAIDLVQVACQEQKGVNAPKYGGGCRLLRSLAISCAIEGKIPAMEQRLADISEDKQKAWLCVGIARGLAWKLKTTKKQ